MRGREHSPTNGLVRVTVASPTRRADLVVPAAVPVAELVPELVRSVGMLELSTVHDGHRLVTASGRELVCDASLAAQGVVDGHLLAVVSATPRPRELYDDVAEAMADVVERELEPREREFGRRAALTTAVSLAALGALALAMVGSIVASVVGGGARPRTGRGGGRPLPGPERGGRPSLAWRAWLLPYAAVAGFRLPQTQRRTRCPSRTPAPRR